MRFQLGLEDGDILSNNVAANTNASHHFTRAGK
jgi:hypothetical protein